MTRVAPQFSSTRLLKTIWHYGIHAPCRHRALVHATTGAVEMVLVMRRSDEAQQSSVYCGIGLVLCGVLLVWGSAAWAAERGNDANGKKLYLTYCFTCHGKDGKGEGYAAKVQPVRPRDLTSDTYMSTRTDQQLFNGH